MTITVDTGNISVATPAANASSPQTFSHTCGANVDALVVKVTIYDTSSSDGVVSGVKYNGVSFDSPAATLYYDPLCDGHCSVWLLPNPIIGDSYTVEVSFGGVVTDFEAAATGIESTVGTFAKDSNGTPATGTSGDLSITWNTIAINTIVFSCSLDDQTDAGKVHPQSTQIYNVDVGDVVSAQYEIRTSSGSQTQTIVDDDGDEDWVIVGAAFKEVLAPVVIPLDTALITAGGQALSFLMGAVSTGLDTAALIAGGQSITIAGPYNEVKVDFEENDLTDFDSTTGVEDLAANATAAMVGTYGMEYTMNDVSDHYGTLGASLSVLTGDELRIRWYFDPNSVSYPDANDWYHLRVSADGTYSGITLLTRVRVGWNTGTGFFLNCQVKDDADTTLGLTVTDFSDAEHYLEIYVKRESSDGGADGEFRAWIDEVEIAGAITNLENYNLFPTYDFFDIGGVSSVDATPSGSVYIDDIILRDGGDRIGAADVGITINLDTAAITAGGQVLALSLGAVTTGLNTASLTAGGQVLVLVPGTATIGLNTGSLTAGGQALSLVMGAVSTGLNTALITANGQALTLAPGGISTALNTAAVTANGQVITISLVTYVSLNTAQLTANGQAISLSMGAVSTGLNTATLTANGQAITIAAGIQIALNTATLTANGQALLLAPGAVFIGLGTAALTANGQVITIVLVGVPISIPLDTAALTANGQAILPVPGAVSVPVDTALLNALGQSLGVSPGAVTIALLTAALSSAGQPVVLSPGAVSMLLDTAALAANGQTLTVAPGAVSISLNTALVSAAGQSLDILLIIIEILLTSDVYITQQKSDSVFVAQEKDEDSFITQQVEDEGYL